MSSTLSPEDLITSFFRSVLKQLLKTQGTRSPTGRVLAPETPGCHFAKGAIQDVLAPPPWPAPPRRVSALHNLPIVLASRTAGAWDGVSQVPRTKILLFPGSALWFPHPTDNASCSRGRDDDTPASEGSIQHKSSCCFCTVVNSQKHLYRGIQTLHFGAKSR